MPKKKNNSEGEVKAVLFDLGKVLIRFNFEGAYKKLAADAKTEPKKIEQFFRDSGLEVLYDGGKLSSREFYQKIKSGLGLKMGFLEFKHTWNHIFTPIDPMIDLLKKLHKKRRLVLISNTNAMHYEFVVKKYDFLNLFDAHILSYKEKIRKPDERIYKIALKKCKAKAHEVFYIDDRHDLTHVAKSYGFKTHTFKDDHEVVNKKLKKLKVLP